MKQQIVTAIYVAGILGLFYLNRNRRVRSSFALWIPTLWLIINASRPVSMWFASGPSVSSADEYLEGSPFDATVYGVLIIAAVATLSLRGKRIQALLKANLPILLFFAYCFLSIFWSDYSFIALKRWIKAVGDFVMIAVVMTDANPMEALKRLVARIGFILLPLSILFIKYYPNIGRTYNRWTWTPMYGGVTTFKNLLGMTCLVYGLGSLWCLVMAYKDRGDRDRLRHMLAHGIIVAMAIWLFRTADSMTSLSCFGLAGGVIVMTSLSKVFRKPALVHIMVAGVIGLALVALFLDSGGGMVRSLGRDASLTGRTAIWDAVFAQHTNPIIGTGFESFWMEPRLHRVWDLTEKGIQEAHDGYIEMYLNLGWVGLIFLGVLIVTGYRHILALLRHDPTAGRIRIGYFVVGVIYNFTEAGFRMMSPVWSAFLIAITVVPQFQLRRARTVTREVVTETDEYGIPAEIASPMGSTIESF